MHNNYTDTCTAVMVAFAAMVLGAVALRLACRSLSKASTTAPTWNVCTSTCMQYNSSALTSAPTTLLKHVLSRHTIPKTSSITPPNFAISLKVIPKHPSKSKTQNATTNLGL
jgi:hypothetical protein